MFYKIPLYLYVKGFFMYKCKHCQKELKNLNALRVHSSKIHKLSSQEVYNQYLLNGEQPVCKCGCGQLTPFITLQKGYNIWIRGHISKVKNNWGHNKKAIDNSAQTRREQYENGERKVWNAGLTKESDERVKKYGLNCSISIKNNSNEIDNRRERMQKHRLDGTIPTRWGNQSSNWKGGTSTINSLVRANKRLYTEWIYPILVRDSFKCTKCGNSKKLEVHHSNQTMSEILLKHVKTNSEYDFDEKREIMNKVIDYHISNQVEGKTLCRECHKKLHPSYNV